MTKVVFSAGACSWWKGWQALWWVHWCFSTKVPQREGAELGSDTISGLLQAFVTNSTHTCFTVANNVFYLTLDIDHTQLANCFCVAWIHAFELATTNLWPMYSNCNCLTAGLWGSINVNDEGIVVPCCTFNLVASCSIRFCLRKSKFPKIWQTSWHQLRHCSYCGEEQPFLLQDWELLDKLSDKRSSILSLRTLNCILSHVIVAVTLYRVKLKRLTLHVLSRLS